ncbi:FctA domain-containing protein, partial [Vibrio sp. FNV 38]|nr:FctA domain-containing protein [Vibrio sp. FNV 38]
PTYDPDDKTITNSYSATGTGTIQAIKAISGHDWPEGGTVTFTLSAADGVPMPTENVSVELKKAGTATFGTITYSEAGTYTYTISESATGFDDGWTLGGDITVTTNVTDNDDGTLTATPTYDPDDQTITNSYSAT